MCYVLSWDIGSLFMYCRYVSICLRLSEYLCGIYRCMHHTNVIARTSFYSQTRELLTMENAQWPYQPLTAGTNCCWVKFRFHFQDMFASDRWCFIRLCYTHRQAKRHEETNRAGSCVYWTFSPIRRMGSQSNTDGHRWRLFADSIIVYKSKMGSPNIPGKRLTVWKSGGDGNSSIIILSRYG